jgi:protein O-mannosyl-transferase
MAKKEKKQVSKKPAKSGFDSFINKYGWTLLILLPLIMYGRTINYSITQLDDYIFIFDKADFNKHFANIFKAFTVGVFNERDVYYRPLFLVSFVLEFPLGLGLDAGPKSLIVYHVTNLLLHLTTVLVLFSFLKQINIKPLPALLLTLIFALHPVLTMAVAWIPGRNDIMLTLFGLLFFKSFLHYVDTRKQKYFFLQLLWLTLAFFTKETAVLLPFVAVGLYFVLPPLTPGASPPAPLHGRGERTPLLPLSEAEIKRNNDTSAIRDSKQKSPLFGGGLGELLLSWVAIFISWYLLRAGATDSKYFAKSFAQLVSDSFSRLPAYLVYIGKIFIPANLSVFPSLSNSTLVYGFISSGILAVIIFFTKKKNYWLMLFGFLWFIIFILPFFFVPKEINDQVFEHRLYLPLIGILILLSQTFLFNGEVNERYTIMGSVVLLGIFFFISNSYIKLFSEPVGFWEEAVESSPQSSYAQKLLGVRLMDVGRKDEALVHIKEAYRIDKSEKYCRYFIARDILEPKDSLDKAETLLRQEIAINPTYTEAYFELSHVFFMKDKIDSSLKYLIKSREFQPSDKMINNNLLLTYIKLNDYKGAKNQVNYMINNKLDVSQNMLDAVELIPH